MVTKEIIIRCPFCGSDNISTHGQNKAGKRVYYCKNSECTHKYFVEEYTNKGYDPEIRKRVLELTVNGNGTCAIARLLSISANTVTSILKNGRMGRTGK